MRLRDFEGDIWESDGEGGWEINSPDPEMWGFIASYELLERVWGPLSEVEE